MSQATLSSEPYTNSALFSGYYLDERVSDLEAWDCDDDARDAFEQLQQLWDLERDLVASYKEDELLDSWIDEVLDILGFGTLSETTIPDSGGYNDRLLFESDETRRDGALRNKNGETEAMYGLASAVLEAKQWDADFTERFSEKRSYRDASHQIKYYLEHTPEDMQWGILTDGRKWRLYGTKDYATEIYYEIDLPELLDTGTLEQFKYFYAFFRPDAFRETAGTTFLDTVWSESETAAQELGADLQDNVFTALRVLGEGFLHTNDLDIDPEDEAAREELKEQSLVLLYRLMFVLYAESRGLIHPDDPDSRSEYEEHFSLDQLRSEIHEDISSGDSFDDYSGHSTQMWGRLQDLFGLVDEGEESLGIPPYNGGLFDDDSHEFLAANEVSDRHIAEVIYRLGTTEGEDGEFVLADYADLDTRHLGSIYEGLLEHEFRIAPETYAAVAEDGGQVWEPGSEVSVSEAVETVEEGELYVVNDDGERKATGAYYTPDYVVSYIVEETIDPLLDDIKAELEADGLEPSDTEYFRRFWQQVLDLKVLDPAMGSAHFLTSATGYLTEQVMEVVREQEIQSYDEQELRREIAKECIYGVDINGMAVELGKLSMWLETLAADQPLAFLDHHLKAGNSLVGSDITEVLSDDVEDDGGQLTLGQAFARARQQTLEHVMELMQDLLAIDNETLEDIKSMEELYGEIRDDPLYQRLFEVANVHTAEEFGLDVPDGVYEEMAGAIENEDEWDEIRDNDWFRSAQAMADDEDFFHWELEYPEVFFGADGEKLDGAGFDAVVGNPPYGLKFNSQYQDYLREIYSTASREYDSYTIFMEKPRDLLKTNGNSGLIVPSMWTKLKTDRTLREIILTEFQPYLLVDCGEVFKDATVETVILCLTKTDISGDIKIQLLEQSGTHQDRLARLGSRQFTSSYTIEQDYFAEDSEYLIDYKVSTPEVRSLIEKIESQSVDLGSICDVSQGVTAYDRHAGQDPEIIENRAYHSEEKEGELYGKWLNGRDVSRYRFEWNGEWLKYGKWLSRPREPKYFNKPRLLFREVTGGLNRVIASFTDKEYYYGHSVIPALTEDAPIHSLSLLSIVNSKLLSYYNLKVSPNAQKGSFPKMNPDDVRALPIVVELSTEFDQELSNLAEELSKRKDQKNSLNLSLQDHLGSYSDGQTLADIGLTQPPEGSADSILQQTTEQKPNLRVGEASVVRESDATVEIRLTARYKPEDEDSYETDQWGYTETDPLPALRITDLTETEVNLIEAFVPVAVDEAGGFADFRETATKTNSLVDRLRKLTLPAVDDVREGLESYTETVERAAELEAKIEQTDELIDEIVYELYGLTDEEIEIVEEAVGDD
ncbi:N-6 DNA methylase [Halomicrobium mukohataei]|uniref:site-specific DNA-methyltransferase (adenine-specific) n=1 Tax=Halomicrobium mukohataei TaxID=57705 RepID=A0A847UCW9_9EURY|nr:TaqI-like C-terminal specificity domain-containing protein [Halomicrobium mukohataei]NLV11315.1 N-6 DNA methylase [Halomicrobium mukohataei]